MTRTTYVAAPILVAAIFLLTSNANGQIVVSDFTLTNDSVSFDITGTLFGLAPEDTVNTLYFANSVSATPGFVTPVVSTDALSFSWTGSQSVRDTFPFATGGEIFGDYFYLSFDSPLSVGEAVSGSVASTFAQNTFDPNEIDSVNVIWGVDSDFDGRTFHDGDFLGGTLQTVVAIPEPSSLFVLGTGIAILACKRRNTIIGT